MNVRYPAGDTIVALATAPLPAGVAMLRLSGPHAWMFAGTLLPKLAEAEPRTAIFGALKNPADGTVLDEALVLGFRAPASFTGEDVVELHLHGGTAVVQAVLDALYKLGARAALPGEFSRRAVLNGKMDLTAAEGIADLIAAGTDAQRRQALRLMDGELGAQFERWRGDVLMLLAQVEAAIDFPDEELEVLQDDALQAGLHRIMEGLNMALATRAGERVREGLNLAIIGLPNAGKSTLLNVLAGRAAAIVSAQAGTTRDVVSQNLDIGGYPVTVLDTAGLRETHDSIEAEGVRRALSAASRADIVLAVVDARQWPGVAADVLDNLVPERTLIVISHADGAEVDISGPLVVKDDDGDDGITYPTVAVELNDAAALPRVLAALLPVVASVAGVGLEAQGLTRARHRVAVKDALAALGAAQNGLLKAGQTGSSMVELVAHDLRTAAAAIGSVTSRTGSEDVLDVVFSTFCVGK